MTTSADELDDVLRAAYAGLDGPPPPPDVVGRVGARVRTRRRRRRAGVAIAATVTVAAALAGYAALGADGGRAPSGDDLAADPTPPTAHPGPGGSPRSDLTVDLPDGSRYTFRDLTVTCDPDESPAGGGSDDRPHLWAYSPGTAIGDRGRPGHPVLILDLRPDLVHDGDVLRLPVEGRPGPTTSVVPALVLVAAETDGRPVNETSSSEAGSTGVLTVDEISCEPEPVLRLSVDAVLASEIGQQSLSVSGSLR